MVERENYLWVGLFLTQERPSDAVQQAVCHFMHHMVPKEGGRHIDPDWAYDGGVQFRTTGMDLSAVGEDSRYRWLMAIKAILPGRMYHGSNVAVFAHPIPIEDMYVLPDGH